MISYQSLLYSTTVLYVYIIYIYIYIYIYNRIIKNLKFKKEVGIDYIYIK